jgi:hypothetical protein
VKNKRRNGGNSKVMTQVARMKLLVTRKSVRKILGVRKKVVVKKRCVL